MNTNHVRIILADRMGYPPVRTKQIAPNHSIECGFLHLLESFHNLQPGVNFSLTFVVNQQSNTQNKTPSNQNNGNLHEDEYTQLKERFPFIKEVLFRSNVAMDIGGYDFGYKLLRKQVWTGDVLFLNSSVIAPKHHLWLKKYFDLFRKRQNTGLCGTAVNMIPVGESPSQAHVHSLFLYSNMIILDKVFGENLIPDPNQLRTKEHCITLGEIR